VGTAISGMGLYRNTLTVREYKRISIAILHELQIPYNQIAAAIDVDRNTVELWSGRQSHGLDYIDRPRSGPTQLIKFDSGSRKRIIAFYCQTTMLPNGHGRWTLRKAATYLKEKPDEIGASPSKSTIQRILAEENLKPHRTKYFLHITDPDFFPKMEHLIELRQRPPKHLFFFDECPGIQIRQRLSPGILSRMSSDDVTLWLEEFEYIRNGTLDVFAFLDNKTGNVYGECRADHKQVTLNDVFRGHVRHAETSAGKEQLHYVLDNLASHYSYDFCRLVAELSNVEAPECLQKADGTARREWLGRTDKRIVIHYTPFHGSWLNAVENWFGVLAGSCLKESYASPDEIRTAIESFILQWNTYYAHPFSFNYTGEGLHRQVVQRFIQMLTDSLDQFNNRFLGKQLILITHLFNEYRDQIDENIWTDLASLVSQKDKELAAHIQKDDKPTRKLNTGKALEKLQCSLRSVLTKKQPA